jgi:hypothetical protein
MLKHPMAVDDDDRSDTRSCDDPTVARVRAIGMGTKELGVTLHASTSPWGTASMIVLDNDFIPNRSIPFGSVFSLFNGQRGLQVKVRSARQHANERYRVCKCADCCPCQSRLKCLSKNGVHNDESAEYFHRLFGEIESVIWRHRREGRVRTMLGDFVQHEKDTRFGSWLGSVLGQLCQFGSEEIFLYQAIALVAFDEACQYRPVRGRDDVIRIELNAVYYAIKNTLDGADAWIALRRMFTNVRCTYCYDKNSLFGVKAPSELGLPDEYEAKFTKVTHYPHDERRSLSSPSRCNGGVVVLWPNSHIPCEQIYGACTRTLFKDHYVCWHVDTSEFDHPHLRLYPKNTTVGIHMPKFESVDDSVNSMSVVRFNLIQIDVLTRYITLIFRLWNARRTETNVQVKRFLCMIEPFGELKTALDDPGTSAFARQMVWSVYYAYHIIIMLGNLPNCVYDIYDSIVKKENIFKSFDSFWPHSMVSVAIMTHMYPKHHMYLRHRVITGQRPNAVHWSLFHDVADGAVAILDEGENQSWTEDLVLDSEGVGMIDSGIFSLAWLQNKYHEFCRHPHYRSSNVYLIERWLGIQDSSSESLSMINAFDGRSVSSLSSIDGGAESEAIERIIQALVRLNEVPANSSIARELRRLENVVNLAARKRGSKRGV